MNKPGYSVPQALRSIAKDIEQRGGMTASETVLAEAANWAEGLEEQFEQQQTQVAAFKAFTDAMLDISWKGGDADGAHIQELALKLGLLKEVVETERCSDERCICAEVTDFPTTCNRKTYLGKEV